LTLVGRELTVTTREGRALLTSVDVTFRAGAVTVVLGENGAGKSTLLDALAGVRALSSGTVSLDGDDVHSLSPFARACRIASLAQTAPFSPLSSTLERIAHGLVQERGKRALLDGAAIDRVREIAHTLDVDGLLDKELGTLSGGERRRVEIARALVDPRPGVVILDEPYAGIDIARRSRIGAALRARARAGAIVVVSVHEIDVALAVGDTFIGIRDGRVASQRDVLDDGFVRDVFGVDARIVQEGVYAGALLSVASRD
jgi:iron complex transport system ATP-binding protein